MDKNDFQFFSTQRCQVRLRPPNPVKNNCVSSANAKKRNMLPEPKDLYDRDIEINEEKKLKMMGWKQITYGPQNKEK